MIFVAFRHIPLDTVHVCETDRHRDMTIIAEYACIIFTSKSDTMIVHEMWFACGECRKMMNEKIGTH